MILNLVDCLNLMNHYTEWGSVILFEKQFQKILKIPKIIKISSLSFFNFIFKNFNNQLNENNENGVSIEQYL